MQISRRTILHVLFGGSLAAIIAPALAVIARFISPLPQQILTAIAGRADEFSDTAAAREIKVGMKDVLVLRTGTGTFLALDLKCTHAGCTVHWLPSQQMFRCPCHGGEYDATGNVIKGPPPRPLAHLQVDVNKHGDVIVTDVI